ncbi:MAG: ANTAR domain-containing protein [Mycobacterium sp.]
MAATPPDDRPASPDTDSPAELQLAYDQKLRDAVASFDRNRSGIEQAKGMLMFIYGISSGDAFQLLSSQSQATNVKVRSIAERLVVEFVALPPEQRVPDRQACNEVLFKGSPPGRPMPLRFLSKDATASRSFWSYASWSSAGESVSALAGLSSGGVAAIIAL